MLFLTFILRKNDTFFGRLVSAVQYVSVKLFISPFGKIAESDKKQQKAKIKLSNIPTLAEGLSKFTESFSTHYVQLFFFSFILCTISFDLFSLYSFYNYTLYNYDFPLFFTLWVKQKVVHVLYSSRRNLLSLTKK